MENTVPVLLPNGVVIRVEATPNRGHGDSDVSFDSIQEALASDNIPAVIEGIGEMVLEGLKKVAPHKATVEFALELSLESGKLTALWVKGSGKASLKIALEWDNPDAPAFQTGK